MQRNRAIGSDHSRNHELRESRDCNVRADRDATLSRNRHRTRQWPPYACCTNAATTPIHRSAGAFLEAKLKPLDQQVIVITGASSGIGLASAQDAAQGGAKLVLAARSEERLAEIVESINDEGWHASGGGDIYGHRPTP